MTYAICILLSAFLLFLVQPIISKTLLPWFGGTPAVWSAAMLFFQVLLTGGYAWSNGLARKRISLKRTLPHLILLVVSLGLVIWLGRIWPSPVTPAAVWHQSNLSRPLLSIFMLLTVSVALPFFVLSTNSPLMQDWFTRKNPGKSPYWLYALSNIGSLGGLIVYPFMVEPLLTTTQQGWLWSAGYFLFILFAVVNVFVTLRAHRSVDVTAGNQAPVIEAPPAKLTRPKWVLLSACASLLLLAVTNQITQEVAVIPFLWVLPLSLYLLSFVLTFSNRNFYKRGLFTFLLFIGTAACLIVLVLPQINFIIQIIAYNYFLFVACMVCNGELYTLRPSTTYLTHFYLWGSIGGAIGGIFVNLIASLIFRDYWELHIGMILVWLLLWISHPLESSPNPTRPKTQTGALAGAMTMVITTLLIFFMIQSRQGISFARRNFFGIVTVRPSIVESSQQPVTVLAHGITLHGYQYLDPALRDTPTSYYIRDSGAGLAILSNPHYGKGMRVGLLGLGIGTLAAFGQPGDLYRFYEINPVIIDLAKGQGGYFSFLQDSQAEIEIVQGDARISLENELLGGQKNDFDILVLDTFNSDSIPVHLISKEAFEVYLQHLAPDGLIAAHISNLHLDLRPVFWQLAQHYDLQMAIVEVMPQSNDPTAAFSDWVLLTRNPNLLQSPALAAKTGSLEGFRKDTRLWTDEYSNMLPLLK